MVDVMLFKTDVVIGKVSFMSSDGNPVDGRGCESLLNLFPSLLKHFRDEVTNYQTRRLESFLQEVFKKSQLKPVLNLFSKFEQLPKVTVWQFRI